MNQSQATKHITKSKIVAKNWTMEKVAHGTILLG